MTVQHRLDATVLPRHKIPAPLRHVDQRPDEPSAIALAGQVLVQTGIAPAAGFASTVEDLARFASWQFRVLDGNDHAILGANTLREMQRVHWVDPDFSTMWGLGFAVSRGDGSKEVGHGGSCPGFRSTFQMIPAKKIGGAVMMNAQGNPSAIWTQIRNLLGAAVLAIHEDPEGGEVRPPELAKYVGVYESTWGETGVVRWDDGLGVLNLPTGDPKEGMRMLKHEEGHTFRRVRDDGELGEAYVFAVEGDRIVAFSAHGNASRKIR